MRLAKEIGQRVLFCGLLFLMVVEAIPPAFEAHERLDDAIDPLVDVTGLWQFPWDLFAPEVDKVRMRVSAEFTYADGGPATWESPKWSEVSVAGKLRHFREITFFDRIRRDSNDEIWPAFARYLAREKGRREDGSVPVEVELWRHKILVLPPQSEEGELAPETSERFHTEELAPKPEEESGR